LQRKIDDIQLNIDETDQNGINTKTHKKERDDEMNTRMAEMDKERDMKLATVRQDYLDRIKLAGSAEDKERLLAEMGMRLKATEDALNDERKR
jgi:pyruvate/2-oxoacid:ferredoxin oxidoreductase alpha subunit